MSATRPDDRLPGWALQLVVLPLLFLAGAKLSLVFSVTSESLVMMWIPNSLVLAALLHFGWRRFPSFALAILVAELAADWPTYTVVESLCFGLINLLEVSAAACLLRRWRFDAHFRTPLDIGKFVLAGPMLGALLSAGAGAAVYRQFRGIETETFEFMRIWWFSDGLGLMILTPLVLSIWPPEGGLRFERPRFTWMDAAALAISLALLLPFLLSYQRVFHGVTIRSFFLILPLLYVAARFSVRVTAANVAVMAMLLLYVVRNGQEPFGAVPILETVTSAQELIFAMSAMSLGIATLLAQHRANARELEARVAERTAELTRANEELQRMAVTDPLTGVSNRRALIARLQAEIARAQRYGHPLGLIMADIDHFKQVNDRYGHDTGDIVLRHMAQTCSELLRVSDVIARYGGEEFVILVPETGEADALELAERLRAALAASPVQVGEDAIRITASFGVAMLGAGDRDGDSLFHRADQAMYAAKQAGRNRVMLALPAAAA